MKIEWKNMGTEDEEEINSWLSQEDKKMLCMEGKSWQETANDIEDCLNLMKDSQFRNVVGYIKNKPVCALMFGVEFSGEILRIYNIVVNPNYRGIGIGKEAIKDVLLEENVFDLNKTYFKITTSVFPENKNSIKLFNSLNFEFYCQNDAYWDFSKNTQKELTR